MVHINSSGDYAWRADLYDRVGEQLGERTTSGAIDGACEFTEQMIPNLQKAIDHPDMTPELAEILSTRTVQLEYRIETDIRIGGEWPSSQLRTFCNRRASLKG